MRLKHRYWAEYTAREFTALDRSRLIAVLPVAAVEQHGAHLPLSVDRDVLNGIIAAAVTMMPGAAGRADRASGAFPGGQAWQMQDLNAAGACGNAATATAATGAAQVDHGARQLVALLEEVQRLPADWLDTRPDPDAFV